MHESAPISDRIRRYNEENDGKQRGSPDKAAEIMVKLANLEYAGGIPVRLALGSDAYENILETYEENKKLAEQWKEVSCSTDYSDANIKLGPKHP